MGLLDLFLKRIILWHENIFKVMHYLGTCPKAKKPAGFQFKNIIVFLFYLQ